MHVAINALCITNRSGTGRYAYGLIDGLVRISTGAVRFSIFVPSDFTLPQAWRSHPSLAFYSIAAAGALQRVYYEQFQLPALLKTIQPGVLHSPAFIAPVDAPKHIRQVVSIHDLAFLRFPETIPSLRLAYYRWAIPRSMRLASRILTDAPSVIMQMKEFGIGGNASAVPLGVDTRVFHPKASDEDAAVIAHYGIKPPYILFVGTQEPRKNLPMLLRAFQTAREHGLGRQLVLAGRQGWLQSQSTQEGVHRIGFVADEHLPALYRQAEAFAAPSLDEGFNLPAAEARACGAPVIASDIAVHRETLGQQAVYISPHEVEGWATALASLQDCDGGLFRLSGQAARPLFNSVRDWTDVAKDTVDIYTELLAG